MSIYATVSVRRQTPEASLISTRLASYAEILDAEVIALQEVESPKAERVFDPGKYQLPVEDTLRTGFAVRVLGDVNRRFDIEEDAFWPEMRRS